MIGMMEHEQTLSHVSQATAALWILHFLKGLIEKTLHRVKKNEAVEEKISNSSWRQDGLEIREKTSKTFLTKNN